MTLVFHIPHARRIHTTRAALGSDNRTLGIGEASDHTGGPTEEAQISLPLHPRHTRVLTGCLVGLRLPLTIVVPPLCCRLAVAHRYRLALQPTVLSPAAREKVSSHRLKDS